jgi:hypothetical protein
MTRRLRSPELFPTLGHNLVVAVTGRQSRLPCWDNLDNCARQGAHDDDRAQEDAERLLVPHMAAVVGGDEAPEDSPPGGAAPGSG